MNKNKNRHTHTWAFVHSKFSTRERRLIFDLTDPEADLLEQQLIYEARVGDTNASQLLHSISGVAASQRKDMLNVISISRQTPGTPTIDPRMAQAQADTAFSNAEVERMNAEIGARNATEQVTLNTKEIEERDKQRKKDDDANKKKEKKNNTWHGFSAENPTAKQKAVQTGIGVATITAGSAVFAGAAPILKGVPVLGALSQATASGIGTVFKAVGFYLKDLLSYGPVAAASGALLVPTLAVTGLWAAGKIRARTLLRENMLRPDSDPDKQNNINTIQKWGFTDFLREGAYVLPGGAKDIIDRTLNAAGDVLGVAYAGGSRIGHVGKMMGKAAMGGLRMTGNVAKYGAIGGAVGAGVGLFGAGFGLAVPAAAVGSTYGLYKWATNKKS